MEQFYSIWDFLTEHSIEIGVICFLFGAWAITWPIFVDRADRKNVRITERMFNGNRD